MNYYKIELRYNYLIEIQFYKIGHNYKNLYKGHVKMTPFLLSAPPPPPNIVY